jgi:hypothetical protein
MKPVRLLTYVFLFLLLAFMVSGSFHDGAINVVTVSKTWATPEAPLPLNVFPDGERLRFGVYSNGIKAGEGEMLYVGVDEASGAPLQHLLFRVSTFSVRDQEDILGTIDFLAPVRVKREVRVFGKDESIQEAYAPDHRSVTIHKTVKGKAVEDNKIASQNDLGNVLLLVYRLRNDPSLAVGRSYDINLPTQQFKIKVMDKRMLKAPLGRFEVYYLESTPPKFKIWLKTTPDRLPLRIQGLIAGGMLYLATTNVSVDSSKVL